MSFYVGIDGGGTSVRVVVVDGALNVLAQSTGTSANPNSVGRESAQQAIQSTIHAALAQADLHADQIAGVGAGVAGTRLFKDWLRDVIHQALPHAAQYLSTDYEIALVGAHGTHEGAILIAGTGSIAYGISAQGESKRVGGWGYLLGDEGSGYWIGDQLLRAVVRAADGRDSATPLTASLFESINLTSVDELIDWRYNHATPSDVASLASLVLTHAQDVLSNKIIQQAAHELALTVLTVTNTLNLPKTQIALAGGLLSAINPLTEALLMRLSLESLPKIAYTPVIGAAILGINALKEKD